MDFIEKAKTVFGKSAEASKNAFAKAGEAVQDFSDKSVMKLEIKQYEAKLNQEYANLGKTVFDIAVYGFDKDGNMGDPLENQNVKNCIGNIKSILGELDERKKELQPN